MSAIDREPFPPFALAGAGALVALVLAATAGASVGLIGEPRVERAGLEATAPLAPLSSRDLRFLDTPEGVVVAGVSDHGRIRLQAGEDGFVRGVARSLARERRAMGAGPEAAFRLSAWPDGRLTLTDLATGRVIDLGAFGPTNRAAFERHLTSEGAS